MIKPDIKDIFVLIGLLLIGGGIWFKSPWLACVIDGTLIFVLGFLASLKK